MDPEKISIETEGVACCWGRVVMSLYFLLPRKCPSENPEECTPATYE